MNLGTYIIENYTVNHPVVGELVKQKITYFNLRGEIDNVEFFDGYIRPGYTLKE